MARPAPRPHRLPVQQQTPPVSVVAPGGDPAAAMRCVAAVLALHRVAVGASGLHVEYEDAVPVDGLAVLEDAMRESVRRRRHQIEAAPRSEERLEGAGHPRPRRRTPREAEVGGVAAHLLEYGGDAAGQDVAGQPDLVQPQQPPERARDAAAEPIALQVQDAEIGCVAQPRRNAAGEPVAAQIEDAESRQAAEVGDTPREAVAAEPQRGQLGQFAQLRRDRPREVPAPKIPHEVPAPKVEAGHARRIALDDDAVPARDRAAGAPVERRRAAQRVPRPQQRRAVGDQSRVGGRQGDRRAAKAVLLLIRRGVRRRCTRRDCGFGHGRRLAAGTRGEREGREQRREGDGGEAHRGRPPIAGSIRRAAARHGRLSRGRGSRGSPSPRCRPPCGRAPTAPPPPTSPTAKGGAN